MDTILSSPELQAALGNLILAVITLAITFLTKVTYSFIKTNTNASQFALLEALAAQAVMASEQGAIAGYINDRKGAAMAIVSEGLAKAGITGVTTEQIEAAIEAAVKDNLNPETRYVAPTDEAEEAPPEA